MKAPLHFTFLILNYVLCHCLNSWRGCCWRGTSCWASWGWGAIFSSSWCRWPRSSAVLSARSTAWKDCRLSKVFLILRRGLAWGISLCCWGCWNSRPSKSIIWYRWSFSYFGIIKYYNYQFEYSKISSLDVNHFISFIYLAIYQSYISINL